MEQNGRPDNECDTIVALKGVEARLARRMRIGKYCGPVFVAATGPGLMLLQDEFDFTGRAIAALVLLFVALLALKLETVYFQDRELLVLHQAVRDLYTAREREP